MPTPKWSNPRIENKLKIDLTTIGVPEGTPSENNIVLDKNNQKNLQKVANLNNFGHNKENKNKNMDEQTRSGNENNNHNKVNANKSSNNQGTITSDMFSKLIPSGDITNNNKASVDSKNKSKFK